MSEESEQFLGEIPVKAQLIIGSEQLRLLLTSSRIIVARVGKRGAGTLAGTTLFGRMSEALENIVKGGRESLGKRKLEVRTPQSVLAAHKDNFAFGYEEVVNVTLSEGSHTTSISMLTRDDKYEFTTPLTLDKVVAFLEPKFGMRLAVGRRKKAGSRG